MLITNITRLNKMSNDKRKRLIAAAKKLFTEKGFQATTLAMIATESDVPLGNVYYYFKSKEAFMDAVIKNMDYELQEVILKHNEQPNAKLRLSKYLDQVVENSISLTQFGDCLINISKEASSINNELKEKSTQVAQKLFQWIESQFKEMGHQDSDIKSTLFLQRFYGIINLSMISGQASDLIKNIDALKKECSLNI